MNKIDWKQKLSSRKFWAALIGFVTAVLYGIGIAEETVESVTSIIGALAMLVAYILAEGFIDGKREQGNHEGDTFNTYYPDEYLENLQMDGEVLGGDSISK